MLDTIFEKNPSELGWQFKTVEEKPGQLKALPGTQWESPKFECEPFEYYLLTFSAKADGPAWYSVFFYDKEGNPLVADNYDSLDSHSQWREYFTAYRGREGGVSAAVSFRGVEGSVQVKSVKTEKIDIAHVNRLADDLYSGMPRLEYNPPVDRWRFIPSTIEKLRQGCLMRWVMLGDSIINDTNNSNFESLIKRSFPSSFVHIIPSVRGSTGCSYYSDPCHFQEYAAALNPDLLIIGGLSNGKDDIDAFRRVVKSARENIGCEVMIMSGPMGEDWREREESALESALTSQSYPENHKARGLSAALAAMAREMGVEYLDMAAAWHEYLGFSCMPFGWYHRDNVHANSRGKQVLARIIAKYFAPESE